MASATDQLNRPLGVLRLSLTARCNLACPYCLPDGVEPPGLLSQEQRLRVIAAAVGLGVRSLRLTGGEPLLHAGLEELIAAVQPLRALGPDGPGLREIALTSNGALLSAERARALRAAGLDRITLSLDGTTGAAVGRMAGVGERNPEEQARRGEVLLAKVLAAIEHARAAGFDPGHGGLKLNAVIQRGVNDDQLLPLAALARERGLELRLIEFMDVGNRNGWRPEAVLSAAEMVERIGARWRLEPQGRIAYSCLFAAPSSGLDLRPWLQPGGPAEAVAEAIAGLWRRRRNRWSEERLEAWATGKPPPAETSRHADMAYLGG